MHCCCCSVACPVMGAVQYVPVAAPTARRRTAMDRGPEANTATSTPHNTVDGVRTAASSGGSSADGAVAITSGDEPPSTSEVERGSVEAQYCGMSLMHRSRWVGAWGALQCSGRWRQRGE